jgi:hypothetical protein
VAMGVLAARRGLLKSDASSATLPPGWDITHSEIALMAEPTSNVDDEIQAALFRGHKIEAIKLHRGATGKGLKEAKDFVEALEAELRRTSPEKFTGPSGGCGSAVLAVVAMSGVVCGWGVVAWWG